MYSINIFVTLFACGALQAADFKDVTRTVPLHPNGAVTIEAYKGSIRVFTWDRPEAGIQARIQPAGSSTLDRRRFDRTEVVIDSWSDSASVRTLYPPGSCCSWNTGQNPAVDYVIRMPRTARLTIRDHRSDTEIRDLSGALDLDTHSGTVRIYALSGPLELRTHRGDVRVDVAAFPGNSLVETHRGSVELLLPGDSRFNLQTDLDRKASLESDFPVLAHVSHRRGQSLEGAVNGGGPVLRLSAGRGQIRLRRK